MPQRTKLELTWIGKENRPKVELRILLEDPEKSYHAPHRFTDRALFDAQDDIDRRREQLIAEIESCNSKLLQVNCSRSAGTLSRGLPMDTPSLKLAKKIVERLVHEKLVTEQDGNTGHQ